MLNINFDYFNITSYYNNHFMKTLTISDIGVKVKGLTNEKSRTY